MSGCSSVALCPNQYPKSHKVPFIISSDLECIIEKIDGYKNNPEN